MNLNKSLYGLVQSRLYWYSNLEGAFETIVFKLSPLDPCMLYGIGMFPLIYVYDIILFGAYQYNIDGFIKELEGSGIYLTVEEDVYAFLGVEVKHDNK